jgi:hypothetical protein
VAGQLPVVELGSVAVSAEMETAVTVSATLEAGAPLESLKIKYGTNRANLTEEQSYSGNVAALADGAPIAFDLSGLLPHKKYYFQIVAKNEVGETATLLLDAATFVTFVPTAASAVWTGAESTAASNPRNWMNGAVPSASSDVMVADIYAVRKSISWDLPGTVNSWTQESFAGDSVFVSFQTTAAAPLVVTGDVVFDAGTWTHAGPADEPTAMVNVSVNGDMTIGANARIVVGTAENMNDDDGAPRGYTRGHGPGYLRTAGGSFAGEGGHITNTTGFVSYGSILDPLSYGSGGWGDNVAYAGGGIVKLVVGGALTVDGVIHSRGFGYPLNAEETVGGAGSGGSINLTAASLAGAGSIDANGGHNGLGHIQQLIGQNYARLRMGIGNDFPQGMQIQHVLGHFTPEERELLQPAIDIAVDVIRSFVLAGIDITMNQYNKLGKQCKKPLESTNGSGQPASSKPEA